MLVIFNEYRIILTKFNLDHVYHMNASFGIDSYGFECSNTETIVCSGTDETLIITDVIGNRQKQVKIFKYLGTVTNAKGECEQDVRNGIKAAWLKLRDLVGVIYDPKCQYHSKENIQEQLLDQ